MSAPSESQDPFADPDDPAYTRVPKYLLKYAYDHSDLAEAAEDLHRFLADLATEASIRFHAIEARPKRLMSYRDKSLKTLPNGTPKYADPATQIRDCIAARVILYTSRARDDFASLLEGRTVVFERQNPGASKYNGYDSEHFIITSLRGGSAGTRYAALSKFLDRYPGMEIQLRSVAAHAWAEYEHDVRYKSAAYDDLSRDDRAQIDQWFVEAGGMRRVMDSLFDQVQTLLFPTSPTQTADPPYEAEDEIATDVTEEEQEADTRLLDQETLKEFIADRYPDSTVGPVPELLDHLTKLSISSVDQLTASLSELEQGHVARLMDYPQEPDGVRRLDDELLAALTDDYVASAATEDRRKLLLLRLARVRGKFAIYSIYDGQHERRAVSAARAVRDLAALVARFSGLEAARIPTAVTTQADELSPSSHARAIRTPAGTLYVATNLTRSWAEEIMGRLLNSAPGSTLHVRRAGDIICEAPTSDRPASAR